MRRRITGFHRDEKGDWVAELDCGHGCHMRHQPPFQDRAWVLTEGGRAGHIGDQVECAGCERDKLFPGPEGRSHPPG